VKKNIALGVALGFAGFGIYKFSVHDYDSDLWGFALALALGLGCLLIPMYTKFRAATAPACRTRARWRSGILGSSVAGSSV
jgi:hypothetical protein